MFDNAQQIFAAKERRKIEHNKTYLGSVRLKCDDTSKNFIYKNLNSLLNQFKENKRDKLSKRKEAFNYVKQMIDSDLSQELDLKFLNDEFNVGYVTHSNSRCESVVNLLDTIKLYNQYIADLRLKQRLENDICVDSSCYAARVALIDEEHVPITYHPHLFDEMLETGNTDSSKLTAEQVRFAVDYFELKERVYHKTKLAVPIMNDPTKNVQTYNSPKNVERIAIPSRSRQEKEHYLPKITDNRTGEVRVGECSCEDARFNKNPDCYHRIQAKHILGIPQSVQIEFDL